MEKIAIVGSGPAGLTAAIYAARAGLSPLVIEGMEPGGQLVQTEHVANWPGFPGVAKGQNIMSAVRTQAEEAGARFKTDVVKSVDFAGETKKLYTLMGDTVESRAVIIATGAGVAKTGVPGEARYFGRGVSACLACDGAFYAGRRVAVIGKPPRAEGAKKYLERLGASEVAIVDPAELAEFIGDGRLLTGVRLDSGDRTIPADGAFLLTERKPETGFLKGSLDLDSAGYISTIDSVRTSVQGVFAAGDCVRVRHKQAVIAAGDGALAALFAQEYALY